MLRGLRMSIVAAFVAATPAAAHDFYHPGCCHGLDQPFGDCGPADLVKQVPGGTLFRQRVTGIEVIVPIDFKKRYVNEHDDLYHICVARYVDEQGNIGEPVLYCLYEPPGS
jgi:hypothetical protein